MRNPIMAGRSWAVALMLAGTAVSTPARADMTPFPPRVNPTFQCGRDARVPLDGGRVHAIAVSPVDRDRIVVSTLFGGLWRTEDGTRTWTHLDGLATLRTNDVAYAPDGRTVLATRERDLHTLNGGGIWVSGDGGTTWTTPATAQPPSSPRVPARISAYGIDHAPDNPSRVYVGTDYGVATSDDNGATWRHAMVDATSPVDAFRQQGTVFSVLGLRRDQAIALTHNGIFRSTDGGLTWRLIRAGDFAFQNGFNNIDASPFNPDDAFVLQDYGRILLYETIAGRARFTTLPLPGGGTARGPYLRVARAADGRALDLWVGTGVHLRRATCGDMACVRRLDASSWATLWRNEGLHEDTGDLGVDSGGQPVLHGCDGGVFKPTDATATRWTRAAVFGSGMNSYLVTDLLGVHVVPTGGRPILFFSTQDNALWQSADGGRTWPIWDQMEGNTLEGHHDASSDRDLKISYAKVGCGPPFVQSDLSFLIRGGVPDVDESGASVPGMGVTFAMTAEKWARWRFAPAAEVFVSDLHGQTWRPRARVGLDVRGPLKASFSGGVASLWAPFRSTLPAAGGGERIGLLRIPDALATRVDTLGERDLVLLPDGGSLGQRATDFDWHAAFAVNPGDPEHLLAPDVVNGVVKVSRDGGATWTTDTALTNSITRDGRILMADPGQGPYFTQVIQISFNPEDPFQIFVGTRESGVVYTRDGGRSWTRASGSDKVTYVTGFVFLRDGRVLLSSYGQGLWILDPGSRFTTFPVDLFCGGRSCQLRFPPNAQPDPPPWDLAHVDVFAAIGGTFNGIRFGPGGEIEEMTTTPGARAVRYLPGGPPAQDIGVFGSEQGAGFGELRKYLDATLGPGETINALVVDPKSRRLLAILSDGKPFDQDDPKGEGERRINAQPGASAPADPSDDQPDRPYFTITTSLRSGGTAVLGEDNRMVVAGRGFRFGPGSGPVTVEIDGRRVHGAPAQVRQDGTVAFDLTAPATLAYGGHSIRLVQKAHHGVRTAANTFVKAFIDNAEAGEDTGEVDEEP